MDHNALVYMAIALCYFMVLQAPVVQSECCVDAKKIDYTVVDGTCASAGGKASDNGKCVITICGNGEALRGTYCGRGSCNVFGCNCDGGCLGSGWEETFLQNAAQYKVSLLGWSWTSLSAADRVYESGLKILDEAKIG
ncbi:protein Diedel-like [Drosophila novamexicana]|uniref:protein Diedel-like n=1 Tax=Drosophila novamexicana TaxID=47314 RepID=UPI0011E5D83C|nr:protein Diedel-like [Drosophila novamexicana]